MGNVIVTGGSRGLGLGIAKALSGAGHRVIAVARRPTEPLSEAMSSASTLSTGGSIEFVPFDLGCIPQLPELVRQIRKTFGSIYGLVNNAGMGTSGVLATMHDADVETLIRINTLSPGMLMRNFLAEGVRTSTG